MTARPRTQFWRRASATAALFVVMLVIVATNGQPDDLVIVLIAWFGGIAFLMAVLALAAWRWPALQPGVHADVRSRNDQLELEVTQLQRDVEEQAQRASAAEAQLAGGRVWGATAPRWADDAGD